MADEGAGLKVVPLRDGKPSLNDIPAMLRQMADQIEGGEWGDVPSLLVLMPRQEDYPEAFSFGDVHGKNDPIIVCELAKMLFLTMEMERAS